MGYPERIFQNVKVGIREQEAARISSAEQQQDVDVGAPTSWGVYSPVNPVRTLMNIGSKACS